jgi:hypothetical protein
VGGASQRNRGNESFREIMGTSAAAEGIQDMSVQAGEITRGVSSANRRIRSGSQPTYSIVIASREARRELEAHLHWLMSTGAAGDAEIVVARAGEPTEMRSLRASYPSVRFVALPKDTSLSELRAAGMSEAAGDIVTMLDDSVVMLPGRLAGMTARWASSRSQGTAARLAEAAVAMNRPEARSAVVGSIEGGAGV